jgi:hypothetical protein
MANPVVREAEGISFQGPGEDEMKEQQRVDPELAWVVRWRETGEEPTEGELFLGDSRSKYYWINREVFIFHISRHIFTYPPPIIPRLHFLDCPFYALMSS